MRLFVALELNTRVIANLTDLILRLDPMSPVRWVHPQNMHLTLKYISEWKESRLPEVLDVLHQVRVDKPINVPLAGLGFFPQTKRPRVFWVNAENTPPLRRLVSGLDARLSTLGIAPEVRPFMPHLTLGRLHDECDLTEMHEAIEELPTRDFGTISPDRFVLFGSQITQEGIDYRRLHEFPIRQQIASEKERELVMRY